MKNVTYIIPDLAPATGGPVTATTALAKAQATLGLNISIVTTDWGLDAAAPHVDGVDVRLFPCRYRKWRWAPALGSYSRKHLLNSDIVVIAGLWQYPTWITGKICREIGKPYIVSPHGMLDSWPMQQKSWKKNMYLRFFEKQTLEGAAAVHAMTKGEGTQSIKWNRSVFVVPGGISKDVYGRLLDRSAFYARYPALRGRKYVLFLGRLHQIKQPEVAISAFHKAFKNDSAIMLVMAGPCELRYRRYLQDLVDKLGISTRILFTGLINQDAAMEAYRSASAFVLPSLHENFGFAVVEAMAQECPVIVSDRVDVASFIASAAAGLVIPPDVDSFAQALAVILQNQCASSQMGQNGRQLVLTQFTSDNVAKEFTHVCDDILAGKRSSRAWLS
jgi:glycosyltransferase involved in cell wall biosynthesis